MNFVADRKGNLTKENSLQDRFLAMVYQHAIGRILVKPFTLPIVSEAGGKILDAKCSRILIPPFIRSHSIDLSECERKNYTSYNDFFKRKLREGARSVDMTPESFISPCDSRLSVYEIKENAAFSIKHTRYTVKSLLRSRKLADAYVGGYIWVFRLCVDDYHRYIYTDGGKVSRNFRIPGVYHTVNPVANDNFPIYKENTREYCLVKSDHFGTLLQMEVGAMLVGKIENRRTVGTVKRGQEKGNFAFGGSTVILMTQKGKVCPDEDILINSQNGIEMKVKLGEKVGVRNKY